MVAYGRLHLDGIVAVAVVVPFRGEHTRQHGGREFGQPALVAARLVRERLEVHELRGGNLLEVAHGFEGERPALVRPLGKALRHLLVEEAGEADAACVLRQGEGENLVLRASGEDGEYGDLPVEGFHVVRYGVEAQEGAEGEVLVVCYHLSLETAYCPACWRSANSEKSA